MKNIYIRSLYSSGFSSMMCSFYSTNLSIGFWPWISKDQMGRDRYDKNRFVSTTINDESAASLYFLSKQIIGGTLNNPAQYLIRCNKQTSLLFENDAGTTRLIIEKGKDKIVFQFPIHEYKVKEDGRLVTKTIQVGLIVFTEILEAYLTAVGADRQQDKQVSAEFSGSQPQNASSVWK